MKKILVIGCSFSAGSYVPINKNLDGPIGPHPKFPADEISNTRGWWYYVDHFKDKDVTVFAVGGQGYWSYYQTLLFLNEKNKLHFDEIWIQETIEPRAILLNQKEIERVFLTSTQDELFHFTFFPPTNKQLSLCSWNAKKEILPYTLWSDSFFTDIVKMCAEKINLLCTERNIKGYVWSMYEPIMENNHFTRLLTNVRQDLYDNNLLTKKEYTNSHQTEEGNKYIGELINKACIDMKI